MTNKQTPLFVVSTGRCGSTMLSRLLAQHPDVMSLSELLNSLSPWTFTKNTVNGANLWHLMKTPRAHHRLWLELLDNGVTIDEFRYPLSRLGSFRKTGIPPLLTMTLPELTDDPDGLHDELRVFVEALPLQNLGVQYGHIFSWLTKRFGRRIWVERSGSSLGFMDGMTCFFPDAKYVHVYRDGREMALSASRFPPMRLALISRAIHAVVGKQLYEKFSPQDEARVPEEFRPFLAQNFDVEAFKKYAMPIERFGKMWCDTLTKGMVALAKLPPERVLHLSYEAILENPATELRRFIQFLDPSLEQEAWLMKSIPQVRPNPPKWIHLPADERARLDAACAPGMEMLAQIY
jgi:putative sulfotransferase